MNAPVLTIDDRRSNAWNYAVHAHGTHAVFARRAASLRRKTHARDVVGIAVPVLIAFVATADWLYDWRTYALAILGVVGTLQFILVVWSLVARWDEELAYCIRAMRDSYELQQSWEKIGKGEVDDVEFSYRFTSKQQDVIDSHDVEKQISDREKRYGMRAALFHFRRSCSACKIQPDTRTPRWWTTRACGVCGGKKP